MPIGHIRKIGWPLAIAIAIQAVLVFCFALTRIYSLRAASYDIGAYLQVLASIAATGKPLATLHTLGGEINWFGFHFTPLLYLLAPFFALLPSPALLIGVHALAIALAAVPVFFTARALGLSQKAATVAGMAYLFNPFTLNAGVWGFQEPSLAVLWMAIALWALAEKRLRWLVAASLLLVLTKEHYGLSVAGFGALWYWRYGEKPRAVALGIAGIAALALVILVLMPYFRGNYVHPMMMAHTASDRYSWLFSPQEWLEFGPNILKVNIEYLFMLLFFFGALPLAGFPWLLAGSADLAIILLSSLLFYRSPYGCYSLALMPVMTVAACAGYVKCAPYLRRASVKAGAGCVIALSYLYISCLPLPISVNSFELPMRPQLALAPADEKTVRDITAMLPPDAVLGVQDNIGMLFNSFRLRYVIPENHLPVDATILWLDSPRHFAPMEPTPIDVRHYLLAADNMLGDESVKVVYWQKPWLVMSAKGEEIPGARQEAKVALNQLAAQQQRLLSLLTLQH